MKSIVHARLRVESRFSQLCMHKNKYRHRVITLEVLGICKVCNLKGDHDLR